MERRSFLVGAGGVLAAAGATAAVDAPNVIAQSGDQGKTAASRTPGTLREKLATCTRILAMQGLIGLFGHVSAFDPQSRRVFMTPGMGRDKATLRGSDALVMDLSGKILEGEGRAPVEWPIHTALHGVRADALAVAHLHSPFATLFAIAKREFAPVTVQGSLFGEGVPLYRDARLITTPERGQQLARVIGKKPAVFLRGHGIVVAGKELEEVLYGALVLEDEARKTMQAASLGEVGHLSPEECRAFSGESDWEQRARRAWNYYAALESRWDRQPATGVVPFA
jgi:ribulose-5-phosphate 4-epimerase/fuculose-1-phosphate aldolase